MVVFLLTSFLAFLIVGFALIIEPPQFGALRRVPGVGYISLDDRATTLLRRALLAFIIILAIVAIWLFHGSQVSWRSQYAPNFVFGLLFGPLFAIWLSGVFRSSLATGLGTGQIVLGVLLMILFVVGLLGTETAQLASQLSRKVSKIGVAGAEISFSSSTAERGAKASSVALPPGYAPGISTQNASNGLNVLGQLDQLIKRDCRYIKLAALTASRERADNDAAEPAGEDSCELSEVETARLGRHFSADEVSSLKTELTRLNQGQGFAALAISDYAGCLSEVFNQTADSGFVQDHLKDLVLPLQEALTLAPLRDNGRTENQRRYIAGATNTAANEAFRLIHDIYPIFLVEPKSEARADVRSACAPLLIRVCNPATKLQDDNDWSHDARKIDDCSQVRPSPALDAASAVDICGLGPGNSTKLFDQYRQQLILAFCRYFADPSAAETLGDFRKRPYISIAYVSVMAQLGRYAAGISELYEWLDKYESERRLTRADVISNLGVKETDLWYAIRARSFLIAYTEEWLRSLGDSASDIQREEQLDDLGRIFTEMEAFGPFADPLAELGKGASDLDRDGYFRAPSDSSFCRYVTDSQPTLMYVYLTNKLVFAYNALKHKDYAQAYARTVKAYVSQVMNANLSCVIALYGGAEIAIKLRPDALDLQAQILQRDALAQSKGDDTQAARDLLDKARKAGMLGQELIRPQWQDDVAAKAHSRRFVERIAITPAIDTYESLERTLRSISDQSDDLDR